MDLRALHAFRTVAESGSMTAAAARLGTVQSALSARIGLFEATIGEPLFERLPRGVRLTAAGRRLLPYAEKIERLSAEAVAAARGRKLERDAPFRLGVIEVLAASILPAVLGEFLSGNPGVAPQLRTGVSQELAARLDAGELDAAIVGGRDEIGKALPARRLQRLPLALFLPAERSPRALDQAFAFGPGCVCRARLEAYIHRRRLSARVVELGSVEAILGCVAAGLGMTLMPLVLGASPSIRAEPAGSLDILLCYRPEAQATALALAKSYAAVVART